MENQKLQYKESFELIKNAQRILLTTHVKPDGDAIGSICSFLLYLKNEGKDVLAIVDNLPANFEFIPGTHHLKLLENFSEEKLSQLHEEYDLIVTFDFNEIHRSPIAQVIENAKNKNIPIIEIDHHQPQPIFGTPIIDSNASSTTVLIYDYFIANNIEITTKMATSLLTGILTDTDHLSNSSTNPHSAYIASELLRKGAHLYKITQNTRANKNINTMKLWGDALKKLKHNKKYNIAYTIISQQDLKKYNVSDEVIEGMPNFLTSLQKLNAILVLKETPEGKYKGSFRTTRSKIDVSKLAKLFGGGGHTKAAGFTIEGSLLPENHGWKIV